MNPGRLVTVFFAAAIIAGSFTGCTGATAQTGAGSPPGQAVAVKRGNLVLKVTASGNLAAPDKANLNFGSPGTVRQRSVDMGDSVKKGQALARLDTLDLEKAVRDADFALKSSEKARKDYTNLYDAGSLAQAEAAVAAAGAGEKAAEKAYADVQQPYNLSPYTPSDIAQAQAAVSAADAQVKAAEKAYQDVQPPYNLSPYAPADVAQAKAAVADAEALVSNAQNVLTKAQPATTNEDIAHLHAAADNAQKTVDIAQQALATAKLGRDSSVTATQDILRRAQDAYRAAIRMQLIEPTIYLNPATILGTDTIPDNVLTTYNALLKARDDALSAQQAGDQNVASSQAAFDKAQDALKKAQEDMDRQTGDVAVNLIVRQHALDSARSMLTRAQENLKKSQAGPDPLDIAARKLGMDNANASLVKAQEDLKKRQAGPDPLDIAARKLAVDNAKASLIKAQEDLKKKQAGPDPVDIAALNAQAAAAKAALAKAQDNLTKATIVAPFDGVVAGVNAEVGDSVVGSTTVMVLVNPLKLRLEAIVNETTALRVKTGQDAQVTLDALPDAPISGKVTAISPLPTVQSGVVNYQTFITLDPAKVAALGINAAIPRAASPLARNAGNSTSSVTDAQSPELALKSGLTAVAEIVTASYDNVLLIPRQAVGGSGQNRTVRVSANGQITERPVRLGASDDQNVQVIEGLSEGEMVLLSGATR